MPYPENIPKGMRGRYCTEHDVFHVKNALGQFVCQFCEADLSEV